MAGTEVVRGGQILNFFQAEPTVFPYRLNVRRDGNRGVKDDSKVFVKNVLEGWSCYLMEKAAGGGGGTVVR